MRRDAQGFPAVVAGGLILLAAFFVVWTKADKLIPGPPLVSTSDQPVLHDVRSESVEYPEVYSVGVAQIDITPDYPVRLAGFAKRTTESEGVWLPISAKALTISCCNLNEPFVLICVESLGVPASITAEVAKRLEKSIGLKPYRLAITSTHTHSAPMLRGMSATAFGAPIADGHWKNIDKYTAELTDKLEKVAVASFNDREPSRLMWGIGAVNFGVNRRTKGGPVDRDLPLLAVKGMDGKTKAIYVNYACHCVTLSGNKISGDWAGYAQDLIQREFPTAIALISIGCGADINPSSGVTEDKTDVAEKQGAEIAAEVKRLLGGYLAPIHGDVTAASDDISLEFADLPSKEDLEKAAKQQNAAAFHARSQLDRLSHGQPLQTSLSYPISSWIFGDELAMTFLPGEAVVDYSLRLKKELDGRRLWINAYANDVPCYIPSERVLKEGGYEAAGAMVYYDRPGPLKAGLEAKIVSTVHHQLDHKFTPPFDPNKTNGTLPKSPQQSLTTMQTTPNLRVDLVAAEPLISSPVAIDFGLDGGLWVAEMRDYPTGFPKTASEKSADGADSDAHVGPSGRIKVLRDSDGDGQFDTSKVFLDNLPMPTGVTVWRNGVLICSAPDILYAEDTNGDDRADKVTKLFTGFRNTNIQARVNSLSYGLDGWIRGSCGLAGGTITNFKGEKFALGNRDFRMKPGTGEFEAATGTTQQGLSRDNFGNWFGCDNLNMAFNYPLPEQYLKRNPYIASPPSRYNLIQTEDDARLFPAKADAQRFQLSGAPGTVTAACGLGVYRDSKLGSDYTDNLFVCEPVNLLVHRIIPKPQGSSFVAQRAANEAHTEFLRSSDSWSRPVQAVTGPDGAVWIVDMYRFIIENPRWIPDEERAPLDVRAGTSLGRIYRVRNADEKTLPATRGAPSKNAKSQANSNVVQSPVYRELQLDRMVAETERAKAEGRKPDESPLTATDEPSTPVAKVDRLRELAARGLPLEKEITSALRDSHPGVRAFGLFLAEQHLSNQGLAKEVVDATTDPDTHVRLQAALSLGQWDDDQVGPLLAKMALKDADDPYMVAAIYSSVSPQNLNAFTKALFEAFQGGEPPSSLLNPFLVTAVGYSNDPAIKLALNSVALKGEETPKPWQMNAMANLAQSLAKRPDNQPTDPAVQTAIHKMQEAARRLIKVDNHDEDQLRAAMNLLGRNPTQKQQDADLIAVLLSSAQSPAIQIAAIGSLERIAADNIADVLEEHMRELSPSAQNQAVDTMTNREPWMHKILDGIQRETIPVAAMTINQRQELLGHPKKEIRDRAQALLAGGINSNRQQVVQQYHSATEMKGDVERGKAVFVKTCAQCHRLGDLGNAVGPNLAMVSTKSPGFLLQEILDPNRNVDSRFTSYIAVTKDGVSKTGILSSESSTSVTLLAGEGKKITLLRQDLDILKSSGKSLMPEGFEKDLSQQAVADVIAFLKSVPAISKKFEGNEPTIIKPVSGRLDLSAEKASIIGDQITFDGSFNTIGSWTATQDQVFWSVELLESGAFDVYMDYACDADSAGNGYLIETGSSSLSGQIDSTDGWNQYTSKLIGSLALSAGSHRIVMRPDGTAMKGSLANLRGLQLVPPGEKPQIASSRSGATTNDAKEIARQLLDDSIPEDQRKALVLKHPTLAPQLIVAMTADMPNDTKEEYRRIPWIWRVAVACGRRNQIDQMRPVLDVSLPKEGKPLKDWEAVVVGGGIVNGVGLVGAWPKTRMEEILQDQPDLTARWKRTLELSAEMTEDEKINTGTRYDAMRIIAMDDREDRRQQLMKYLPKGTHDELQMGAISGLGDIDWAEVPKLLLENIGHFNEENRNYAIGAFLKLDYRREALLDALADGRINASILNDAQKKALRESRNPNIKVRAIEILGP